MVGMVINLIGVRFIYLLYNSSPFKSGMIIPNIRSLDHFQQRVEGNGWNQRRLRLITSFLAQCYMPEWEESAWWLKFLRLCFQLVFQTEPFCCMLLLLYQGFFFWSGWWNINEIPFPRYSWYFHQILDCPKSSCRRWLLRVSESTDVGSYNLRPTFHVKCSYWNFPNLWFCLRKCVSKRCDLLKRREWNEWNEMKHVANSTIPNIFQESPEVFKLCRSCLVLYVEKNISPVGFLEPFSAGIALGWCWYFGNFVFNDQMSNG